MNQTTLFDQPEYPPNPYKQGSQNFRLYERLRKYGKVKNIEILYGLGGSRIMNTTGRIADCRAFLRQYGISLTCRPVNDNGVFEYEIGGDSEKA